MKKIIGIIVGVAVVALMVLLLVGNKKKMAEQTSNSAVTDMTEVVSTYTVRTTPLRKEFKSNAAVQASKELKYVSDVSGRVVEIYVDKGSRVQKGTPLLRIDSELIEADYQAALAAYNTMVKDEQRFTRSNEAGGVSDQQLDQIRTQVEAAHSRLVMAKWKKDNAVVKAPMRGTIDMRYVEVGSLIAPNAPLFDIVDNSGLKLICMVPESKLDQITKGQKVTASDNGKTFTGKVTNIGIKTDRGLNYPVDVVLDNDPDLRIGMYLNAHFISDNEQLSILVPRKAIVGSAMAANVFLAVDGKAVRREVKLGDMYGDNIEVTSGLKDGETIIVSGLMNIADGSEIRIVE